MATLPWKKLAEVDRDREYVLYASRLPLRSLRSTPAFVRLIPQIRAQMGRARGAVGYSLRAQVMRGTYWTVSAWEDEESLAAFALSAPHIDVMRALRAHLDPHAAVVWRASGQEIPVRFAEGRARLAELPQWAPESVQARQDATQGGSDGNHR